MMEIVLLYTYRRKGARMNFLLRFTLILQFMLLLVLVNGCSVFKKLDDDKYPRIIATMFGQTSAINAFKVGGSKPYAHIIWGNDESDGARCTIVIVNVTKAIQVYRRDFVHDKDNPNNDYNYEKSKILELDPEWYIKVGKYSMILYVNGERISSFPFAILP
jgi:hypothetical protein